VVHVHTLLFRAPKPQRSLADWAVALRALFVRFNEVAHRLGVTWCPIPLGHTLARLPPARGQSGSRPDGPVTAERLLDFK